MKVVSRESDKRITRWYKNVYIGIIIIIIIIIIITACYKYSSHQRSPKTVLPGAHKVTVTSEIYYKLNAV